MTNDIIYAVLGSSKLAELSFIKIQFTYKSVSLVFVISGYQRDNCPRRNAAVCVMDRLVD